MIPTADSSLVQRLFERLVVALGGEFERPVTIGDVYQRLIPYRSVRSEIGVLELASYEYGLLRLLGGEGGYLELDGATASDEIRRELASPNPILGIYRDYSDVRIRVVGTPTGMEAASEIEGATRGEPILTGTGALPAAGAESPFSRDVTSSDTKSAPAVPRHDGGEQGAQPRTGADLPNRPATATSGPVATQVPASSTSTAVCPGCASELPNVTGIRFCPFCGHLREPFPCGRCGTRLEPEWNFCIRCGAPAGA